MKGYKRKQFVAETYTDVKQNKKFEFKRTNR